ncbi:histidine kinase [Paraburkholderia strydomiana]|jgi:signal transduction histidine kinase|uniref:ATP-binding protein n=1 Tax=Paraburkholderia strydomiana TaxID=1245417 RepID=UPI0038BBA2FF
MSSEPIHSSSAGSPSPVSAIWRDLAWVLAVTALAGVLGAAFDLSERAYRFTRGMERFQLDELPATLCVLSIGLAWFAWRRYRDARRELSRRRALEEQAERLLADNRRLANQALQAQELERRHLARELHDELGQYLNAIALDAARIRDLSSGEDIVQSRTQVPAATRAPDPEIHRVALGLIQSASHVYRQIGDMIRRLRPIGLDEFGLPSALEHCVDGWRERLPDASFSLTIEGDYSGLSDALTITLYRLVQEGLTNVSKFARSSRVEVFMVRAPRETHGTDGTDPLTDEIVVTMADDGPGTDLTKPRAGLGLIGMRERVEALGGEFHVASEPQGGFLFCARVPAHAGLAEPVN